MVQIGRLTESIDHVSKENLHNSHNKDEFMFPSLRYLFVCLQFFVPIKNFSLIWRRHHCRKGAANFELCSVLMAIEQ